jgi:methylglutaconyl-CoA hydratase
MEREVELKKTGPVLEVALHRPLSHNALTPEMIGALTAVFQDVNDRDDIRVVVLTGNGRSFCAGADLNYMRAAGDSSFDENMADGKAIFDLMWAVDTCRKPVVGRVNGAASGRRCGAGELLRCGSGGGASQICL